MITTVAALLVRLRAKLTYYPLTQAKHREALTLLDTIIETEQKRNPFAELPEPDDYEERMAA